VLAGNTAEFIITIIAVPIVLILLILAGIAVQREIKWWARCAPVSRRAVLNAPRRMMTISLALMLASETYFSPCLFCLLRPTMTHVHPTSLQTRPLLRAEHSLGVQLDAHDAHLLQFATSIPPTPAPADAPLTAILAFIVLFATFAVGLRCFADFDKGLIEAKTASLRPQRPPGFSKPNTPAMNMTGVERQSYFAGGQPLAPRMSIE
jgi:hypothetical protein